MPTQNENNEEPTTVLKGYAFKTYDDRPTDSASEEVGGYSDLLGVLLNGIAGAFTNDAPSANLRCVLPSLPSELDEKIKRLQERKELIEKARETAIKTGDQKLKEAADRLELNNKAVEKARLSADVYNDSGASLGFKRLTDNLNNLPEELRNPNLWRDEKSGFYAALYQSEIDGSIVLAFRGTNDLQVLAITPEGLAITPDWITNFQQAFGIPSEQYDRAIYLSKLVQDTYGKNNVEFTGHSLGGSLAAAGGIITGTKTTTFDSAGVHPNTLGNEHDRSDANGLVDNFYVDGELLSILQNPSLQNTLVNILTPPILSQIRGSQLEPIYDAVGDQHKLPAVDAFGKPLSNFDPINRHVDMQHVIDGLEKQKKDDIQTINSRGVGGGAGGGGGGGWGDSDEKPIVVNA